MEKKMKMISYEINEQLGKRIEYLRKMKRFTQETLSFESGINKNYISDLERGKRNPTLKVLKAIADALSVTLENLFKGIV